MLFRDNKKTTGVRYKAFIGTGITTTCFQFPPISRREGNHQNFASRPGTRDITFLKKN